MRATRWIMSGVLGAVLVFGAPMGVLAATSDAWITTKAKMSLYSTEGVSGNAINVDTVDGRVTLHGKVKSAEEKAKAEETVRKIDGVREVRNLLQVVSEPRAKAVKRSDAEIQKEVKKALSDDKSLADSSISVQSVNNGVVLLAGKANTLTDHLRAMGDAARIPGVRRVASEVQGPDRLADEEIYRDRPANETAESRGVTGGAKDVYITSAVKLRLLADSRTPALDINVDTTNGDVVLFGIVPSAEAKAAAAEDARKVGGVKQVANELQVVPKAKQEAVKARDEDIERDVKRALEGRPDLKDLSIGVDVKNGVARLSGTVPTQEQRLSAAVAARTAQGVKSVQDDLRVSSR